MAGHIGSMLSRDMLGRAEYVWGSGVDTSMGDKCDSMLFVHV